MRRRAAGGLLAALVASGCARLPAGDVSALYAPPPAGGRVIVLRGFRDWYSTGMDRLTVDLRAAGWEARAFREEQWGDVADALGPERGRTPLVLIGFSYGADDVIRIARRLGDRGRAVDLLVTIDPVTPDDVPPNVRRCVNFYEPNGLWDLFPWLRGVPLSSSDGRPVPENIDVKSRPDLVQPGTSHGTIAANGNVHRAILERVGQPYPR